MPKLSVHKKSRQWYVKLSGKFHYLGPWKGERKPPLPVESKYHELVTAYLNPGATPSPKAVQIGADITVVEAAVRFLDRMEAQHGRHSRLVHKGALRVVVELFGRIPAKDFGSLRLQEVRSHMVQEGRTRQGVNLAVKRIGVCWKWLVAQELVPPEILIKHKALNPFRFGQTTAPEAKPKPIVPEELAEQTANLASPIIAAMIRLQMLTGMRPGEICSMTFEQIDQRNPACWIYRPHKFKTAYLGKHRAVPLAARAQAVLQAFLDPESPTAAIFSPKATTAHAMNKRSEGATSPSRYDRSIESPTRPPGEFYTTQSYGRAIARLCDQHKLPRWSPSCLRATKAQTVTDALGPEAARALLGHADTAVTRRHYIHSLESGAVGVALEVEAKTLLASPSQDPTHN